MALTVQMHTLISCDGTLCVRDEKGGILVVCRNCTERVFTQLASACAAHGPPRVHDIANGCSNTERVLDAPYCVFIVLDTISSTGLMRELMRAQLVLLVDSWHFAAIGAHEEYDRRVRASYCDESHTRGCWNATR